MKKTKNKAVNVRKQLKVKLENTATRYKNQRGFKPTEQQAYQWFRHINKCLFNSRLPMVPLHVRKLHKDWGRCVANWDNRKTPKGKFRIENLYFRKDRIEKPSTVLKCIKIKKDMGWCNDVRFPKKYNKLIKIEKKVKHEKLRRKDYKYDLLIPIKYNFQKTITGKGSCIFIHLTKDYKATAGCVALKEKDFLIMIKLIKKNSKIKIF